MKEKPRSAVKIVGALTVWFAALFFGANGVFAHDLVVVGRRGRRAQWSSVVRAGEA